MWTMQHALYFSVMQFKSNANKFCEMPGMISRLAARSVRARRVLCVDHENAGICSVIFYK